MIQTAHAAPISAVIVCQDEAELIADCLESVDFCADIVVVDSGSTDGTQAIVQSLIARGLPIRLFHNPWPGFAAQKQFGMDRALHSWCLQIDADERVDERLRDAILLAVTGDGREAGWYLRRRDWLTGYGWAHRLVGHNRILRLVRRDRARMDFSTAIHTSPIVDGEIGTIADGFLLHLRDLTLEDDLRHADRYSTKKAEELVAGGRRPSAMRLVLSPPMNFLKFYLGKRYAICGRPGFVYSMMMLVYSFLTEAKIYRLWLTKEARPEA